MKFIEAINVIFNYKIYSGEKEEVKEFRAIDDISLSIEKGQFVGILGHNGSGKSTLARQLAGLLFPTDGVIYVNGFDTGKDYNLIPVRKSAGMVFQNPDNQLIGNIVEEDVAFGPENLGLPRDEIWTRLVQALEAVGMSAYREHSPQALSGGQKQKIAIAGILAMEPECIILDEPTAMLDPKGRREVMEAINYLNKMKNITIILITHHIEEVEKADYLYVVDHGRLALEGSPKDLWKEGEKLSDCGVSLRIEQELISYLKAGGMEIPDEIQSKDALLDYLTGRGLY